MQTTQELQNELMTFETAARKQADKLIAGNLNGDRDLVAVARVRTVITELELACEFARLALDMHKDDDDLIRARGVVAEQFERAVETLGTVLADLSAPETDTLH